MEFRRLYRTLRTNPKSAIATGLGALSIIGMLGSYGYGMFNEIGWESRYRVLASVKTIDNRVNSLRSVNLDLLQRASYGEIVSLVEDRNSQVSGLMDERERIVSSEKYEDAKRWQTNRDTSMGVLAGSGLGMVCLLLPSLFGLINLRQQYDEPNSKTHYGGRI